MRLPIRTAGKWVAAGALAAAGLGLAAAAPGAPRLGVPIACEFGRNCEIQHYVDRDPGPGVLDYRCAHRTYEGHNGVDFRIPDMKAEAAGVDVLAAASGRVARLRDGVADISIRAPGAPSVKGTECGNGVVIEHGDGWETQYCHLARGSLRVKPGDAVSAGQPIGRVGLSGDTEFPHMHFTVRHAGQVVDPFAPGPVSAGACPAQPSLWTPDAARRLAYKAGAVLNIGLAGAPVTAESIESGQIAPPSAAAPVLAAYGRVIEPQQGDEIEVVLSGPGGATLASQRLPPLERDKAQYFQMVGRKRPAAGWPKGNYTASMRLWRAGKVAVERRATATL